MMMRSAVFQSTSGGNSIRVEVAIARTTSLGTPYTEWLRLITFDLADSTPSRNIG